MPRRLLRNFAYDEIRDLRRAMHDYCLENNLFTLTDSFNEKMFNNNDSPAPGEGGDDCRSAAASAEDDRFASALSAPPVDVDQSTPVALSAQWWNDCELERQSNIERKVSKSGATATGIKLFQQQQQQHSKKSSLRSESLKDHDSRMSDCDEPPPSYNKDEVVHLPSHLREKAANLLRQRKTSKNTRTGQTKASALSPFYVQGDFASDSSRSGSGRSSADGSVSSSKRKESMDNAAHYAQWIDEHQCHEDMVSLDQIYRQQWNEEHGIAGGDVDVTNGTQKLTIDSPEATGRFWFPTRQMCTIDDPQSCSAMPKLGHFYVPYPRQDDDVLTPLQNDIQQIDDNMIEMETTCKPPKVVHNHLIMDEIGSGAYARVKQCLLLGKMEPRAVKIFKIERVRKINHALDDIAFEVDLLKRLKHKNIILMHDYFWNESKGKLYVFLELCHASIQQLLDFHCGDEHRLSLDAAHFYFAQLLQAVKYLHSRHIVHKDIKPGNLLLTLDHVVKLLDFGVSEEVDPNDPGHTCHGGRGTPKLQPPEIAAGGRSFDGFKVDVWCSGVTLYAMVVGQYPFDGSTIYNIYKEILEKPIIVSAHSLKSSELRDLLTKMTLKNPGDRLTVEQVLGHVWVKEYSPAESPPVLHNLLDQSRLDTIEEYLNHYFHHVTECDMLSKSRLDALIEDDQAATTLSQDTVAAAGGGSSSNTLTAPYVAGGRSGGGVKCVRTDPAELASSAAAKSRLAACPADLRPTASSTDVTTAANDRKETPPQTQQQQQHKNKFWRFMNNLKSKFRLSKKSDPKM